MQSRSIFLLGFMFSAIIFSSCCLGDKVGNYEYAVTNNSDSPITVVISSNTLTTLSLVNTFTINVGESATVLSTEGPIVSACDDLEFDENRIESDLLEMIVTNQDSLISSRNYLSRLEWDYEEGDELSIYTITTNEDEF